MNQPTTVWRCLAEEEQPGGLAGSNYPQKSILTHYRQRRLSTSNESKLTASENTYPAVLLEHGKKQSEPRRHRKQQSAAVLPPGWSTNPAAEANDSHKKGYHHLVSSERPGWRSHRKSTFPYHKKPLPTGTLAVTYDKCAVSKPKGVRPLVQKQNLLRTAMTTRQERLPVPEIDYGHPLSDLKWPFDEVFPCFEPTRSGGASAVSTQPSTTGSQGVPHFVTAGPNCSTFGHGIFGYEQEDTILWA